MANCINGSINVYQPTINQPWNKRRVQHLYNRIGTGASLADIQWALAMSPEEVIDFLMDEAISAEIPTGEEHPLITNPLYGQMNVTPNINMTFDFFRNLIEQPLRYKLVLFWSNHFVTENNILEDHASWIHYYLTHLHTHAFGSFLSMTKAIGLTPAMLHYLNGNRNYASSPNENYARELLELFTMGAHPDNYEQEDIDEIARLLTGWRAEFFPYYNNANTGAVNPNFPFTMNAHILTDDYHDWGEKEILGKKWLPLDEKNQDAAFQEYIWLHDQVIFKERKDAVARFICSKLYRFYVYDEINETIVEEMATTFKDNDWEIAPVLRQLFKSEHFFDEKAIGGNIKSPLEFFLGFLKQANLKHDEGDYTNTASSDSGLVNNYNLHRVYEDCKEIGQSFLKPVNVAGWEGGKTWITGNTMVKRWSYMEKKLTYYKTHFPNTQVKFRQLAKDLTEDFSSSEDFDKPAVVVEATARHFLIADLLPSTLEAATEAFMDNFGPCCENESWSLEDAPNVPQQFLSLLIFLTKLPEYQLN